MNDGVYRCPATVTGLGDIKKQSEVYIDVSPRVRTEVRPSAARIHHDATDRDRSTLHRFCCGTRFVKEHTWSDF
jgi:hypothetical protein